MSNANKKVSLNFIFIFFFSSLHFIFVCVAFMFQHVYRIALHWTFNLKSHQNVKGNFFVFSVVVGFLFEVFASLLLWGKLKFMYCALFYLYKIFISTSFPEMSCCSCRGINNVFLWRQGNEAN